MVDQAALDLGRNVLEAFAVFVLIAGSALIIDWSTERLQDRNTERFNRLEQEFRRINQPYTWAVRFQNFSAEVFLWFMMLVAFLLFTIDFICFVMFVILHLLIFLYEIMEQWKAM
jgi:hypothetical protein